MTTITMAQTFKIPVLLYIVFTCPLSVSGDCLIYDDPIYSGLFVSCPHDDLKHVPDLPFNTTSADLSFNSISVIQNGSFSHVQNIKYLDLSHNVLTHLEPGAFQNCNLLQHLDLSDNKLALTSESFPDVVFDPLLDLRWLNMKRNKKGDGTYPERIFNNLGKLAVLSIGAYKDQIFGSGFGSLHSLKELYIGDNGCSLSHIRNSTFTELATTPLLRLDIAFCARYIEAGSLAPLNNLTDLTLYFMYLGTKQTFAALAPLEGRHMDTIKLHRIRFPDALEFGERVTIEDREIFSHSLKHLAHICVKNFEIPENDILWFDWFYLADKPFAGCVEKIDSSFNAFRSNMINMLFGLLSFSKLQAIDFSVPDMAAVNPNVKPKHKYEKMQMGARTYNAVSKNISIYSPLNVLFPKFLTTINMCAWTTTFGQFKGWYNILEGKHIAHLNFSFFGLGVVDARITGLNNLKVLDISGNSNLHFQNLDLFSNFPNLDELRLSYSSFQQNALMEKGYDLLKNLPHLRRLYLAYNQVYLLPSNLFDFSSKLELLDLSGNLFISIPFDLTLLPQLKTLDITFNTITTLKKNDRDMIDAQPSDSFHLRLKYNLFACGCDSIDFLLWLRETHVQLDNGRNYACLEGSEGITSIEEILDDFLKIWRKCNGRSSFYITLVIFTILVASILGTLLVKTNKTSIIYAFLNGLKKQLRKPKREYFKWDVYVAYAEKDYQWICLSLCPRLEEKDLRLYIYDRDSVPGDSIPDQIAENISKSWKIILYFSNNYETDQWSYMSMMAAINSVDNLSPEKLLLLLPEEEHPRLPKCLLEVVPESCIFHVPTGREDQGELFRALVDIVTK